MSRWLWLVALCALGCSDPVDAAGGGDGGVADAPLASGDGASYDAAFPFDRFSFFVTSMVALQELSGNPLGVGGDLTLGETGPGAGLRVADQICGPLAKRSRGNGHSK